MPQGFGVVARDVSQERKVEILFEISVLNPIFRAERLVLMIVILQRFGESHRGQSCFVKWIVIAAPAVAVYAKNQANGVAAIDLFDRASQFPDGESQSSSSPLPEKTRTR